MGIGRDASQVAPRAGAGLRSLSVLPRRVSNLRSGCVRRRPGGAFGVRRFRARASWRAALGAVGVIATLCWARDADADPQYSAGLVSGVCGRGSGSELWQDTCWYNGLRAELLLGRQRSADFGAGPYLDVTTAGFDDVRFGGGLLGLAPTGSLPLVLSLGAYGRRDDDQWFPGLAAWLFVGSRSYNFHSNYAIAAGLLVGYQRDLDDQGANAIVVSLQIDGMLLAIPALFAVSAFRGSPEE